MSVTSHSKDYSFQGMSLSEGQVLWAKAALRWALATDAVFCTLSAIVLMIFHQEVADFIGLARPGALILLGGVLLPWAVFLVLVLKEQSPNRSRIGFIVSMNLAWVVGSALFLSLAGEMINDLGETGVLIIALDVLLLTAWQGIGFRRLPRLPRE